MLRMPGPKGMTVPLNHRNELFFVGVTSGSSAPPSSLSPQMGRASVFYVTSGKGTEYSYINGPFCTTILIFTFQITVTLICKVIFHNRQLFSLYAEGTEAQRGSIIHEVHTVGYEEVCLQDPCSFFCIHIMLQARSSFPLETTKRHPSTPRRVILLAC